MKYSRILFLLALLTAFPPMSNTMYLPALPRLQALWGTGLSTINLTLVLFFVFFSIALLVYGPVSDSYGRRPLLLTGIGIYIAGSLLCATAGGVNHLIAARILQALGAASASALSMAIAKDLFQAFERQRLLAHMGVITALAPMLAPSLGGLVLGWLDWPWIFYIQAFWGGIALIEVWRMNEPLQKKVPARIERVIGGYLRVMGNRRFMALNGLVALSSTPVFAFVAGSPAIYISRFQVGTHSFGLFFGINALALMAGSFMCSRLARRTNGWTMLQIGFCGLLVSGVAIALVGVRGPIPFCVAMFLLTFCVGLTRPMANNLVLEQVREDVGTASSLLVFLFFGFAAVTMEVISLDWRDRVQVIGLLAVGCGATLLLAFRWMGCHWRDAFHTILPPSLAK
jgi:DHA1 family bicyclomycin/chloramphenicol resistance-like MFS transporter